MEGIYELEIVQQMENGWNPDFVLQNPAKCLRN